MNHELDRPKRPIVIAHRGASGYLPEHTLPAYLIAIEQGADFIEPDLVVTKDGHLIARHDNVLNLTTDVASHPEFANRRTTKVVDGVEVKDSWFSEDFTLKEIKTLRAIERIPDDRPANRRFDGMFSVPTLQEIVGLVQTMEKLTNRRIGLYPENKYPSYFKRLGLAMERTLVDILWQCGGYRHKDDRVFIQSFEINNLKEINRLTDLPLIQLLWFEGKPYDVEAAGGSLTYDQMATLEGLKAIAQYTDGVGPEKYHFILPRDAEGHLNTDKATRFVDDAHQAGLQVHPYTFRAENKHLPANLRIGPDPIAIGNAAEEVKLFLKTGIDGFFIDQPDIGVKARDEFFGD